MALLVGFGFWHAGRTSEVEEILTHKVGRTGSPENAGSCLIYPTPVKAAARLAETRAGQRHAVAWTWSVRSRTWRRDRP